MGQMGYNGGGLGKHGNGIEEPVVVERNEGRQGIGNKSLVSRPSNSPSAGEVVKKRVTNRVKAWPKGTVLIIGDSMLGGVNERMLKNYRVKVRSHGGAYVDDLYDFIAPLLKKKPSYIIMHIGTNDSVDKPAKDIYVELINLRDYINQVLPNTKVYLSCPILRKDIAKANRVLSELDSKIKRVGDCVTNDNIDGTCISKLGLHLNSKGSKQLVLNYIKLIQSF